MPDGTPPPVDVITAAQALVTFSAAGPLAP